MRQNVSAEKAGCIEITVVRETTPGDTINSNNKTYKH